MQSGVVPLTEATLAFGVIVTAWAADGVPLHPPVIVKVMVHVPALTPVTRPDETPTVATDGLLLLHAPVPPPRTTVLAV